jgi:ribonuclease P protein component
MFDFGRKYRLARRSQFDHVFATGKKIQHKHFTVRFCPNELQFSRIGLIVPKSVLRKAVQRNRVRRVLRESFRQHKNVLIGLDIVILIKAKDIPLAGNELREEIDKIWPKLHVSVL